MSDVFGPNGLYSWAATAKEISRVLKMGIPEGEDIDISLLEHVSPSNGKTSFFTASMCSTRTTFAKTDP
jgi:hypothetical protein